MNDLLRAPRRMATTRWSVIARAASTSAERDAALAALCQLYWYPLYSFARRAGHGAEDAADLTQEFLTRFLLERRDVERTDPSRGRFRSYLLQAMRNFLHNEWRNARAEKRGGGVAAVRIDARDAEGRYAAEPADVVDPERLYLRRFAITAVDQALRTLERECDSAGKRALFDALAPALVGELAAADAQRVAEQLSMSVGAVKVAAHRLKRRFRDHVRAAVADTVEDEADVDDELHALLAAL